MIPFDFLLSATVLRVLTQRMEQWKERISSAYLAVRLNPVVDQSLLGRDWPWLVLELIAFSACRHHGRRRAGVRRINPPTSGWKKTRCRPRRIRERKSPPHCPSTRQKSSTSNQEREPNQPLSISSLSAERRRTPLRLYFLGFLSLKSGSRTPNDRSLEGEKSAGLQIFPTQCKAVG